MVQGRRRNVGRERRDTWHGHADSTAIGTNLVTPVAAAADPGRDAQSEPCACTSPARATSGARPRWPTRWSLSAMREPHRRRDAEPPSGGRPPRPPEPRAAPSPSQEPSAAPSSARSQSTQTFVPDTCRDNSGHMRRLLHQMAPTLTNAATRKKRAAEHLIPTFIVNPNGPSHRLFQQEPESEKLRYEQRGFAPRQYVPRSISRPPLTREVSCRSTVRISLRE